MFFFQYAGFEFQKAGKKGGMQDWAPPRETPPFKDSLFSKWRTSIESTTTTFPNESRYFLYGVKSSGRMCVYCAYYKVLWGLLTLFIKVAQL